MQPFDMLDAEVILDGRATDAYFLRTEETLAAAEKNPHVDIEVTADQYPDGSPELLAGVRDAARLLKGLPIAVDAMPEGTLFDGGPVMRISGPYAEIARYETSLLGFLSQASGFATRALQARHAAPDSSLLSFGARHVHPAIAPIVERSALIAGFDGISHVASGELLSVDASGTMPHALMLCFGRGEQEAAWLAFDKAVGPEVPRVALCDTFSDEVEEVLRAADALGDALDSVRIDTTSSRRGAFRDILREVRWELDMAGHSDVALFASGGIDLDALHALRSIVDGFGVGSFITSADPVDFAMDIVAVDGEPISKRGKRSGVKAVYRDDAGEIVIKPKSESVPDGYTPLLEPLIRDGEIVRDSSINAVAARTAAQRQYLD